MRYAREIARRLGRAVESPVDPFNRPAHRGDFGLRVPPSRRALREFFAAWRAELPSVRKELVACRDYAMAKVAYVAGVRAAELRGMRIKNLHWESGQFGRFLVRGKGRADDPAGELSSPGQPQRIIDLERPGI